MAPDLSSLVDPRTAALITSECQNGVIGARSVLPELAAAAAQSVIPNGARLCAAARAAGVPVVHCVAGRRPDDRGSNDNARIFAAMLRSPVRLDLGSDAAAVVPEFEVVLSDFVLSRIHGLNPMAGTDLDPILRNLGVSTIVVIGVSLNIAVTNLVMDAVNLGYQVVVPRDAVVGVPPSYGDAVIENTVSLLATVVSTAEVVADWSGQRPTGGRLRRLRRAPGRH